MASKQLAPAQFVRKIKAKMETDHLGVTQLARILGVSHPTIVDLVTYGKRSSFDTTIALSKWLHQSPVFTLREAGLLPPGNDDEIRWEDWKFLISQMTPQEEENMKRMIAITVESRVKYEQSERSRNFKLKKTVK